MTTTRVALHDSWFGKTTVIYLKMSLGVAPQSIPSSCLKQALLPPPSPLLGHPPFKPTILIGFPIQTEGRRGSHALSQLCPWDDHIRDIPSPWHKSNIIRGGNRSETKHLEQFKTQACGWLRLLTPKQFSLFETFAMLNVTIYHGNSTYKRHVWLPQFLLPQLVSTVVGPHVLFWVIFMLNALNDAIPNIRQKEGSFRYSSVGFRLYTFEVS